MKMSAIKPTEALKVLVYGNAGTGKTCFASGFPGPILILDFDGKADSAASYYRNDAARLDQIEVEDMSRQLGADVDPIEKLTSVINSKLIPQQKSGQMEFKTLVVDSLTTFSSAVLNHIIRTNPGIKRNSSRQGMQPCQQDYGILKREFGRLIPGLLSLPCNVVMLGHIKVDKDEMTGEIIRGPLMDGSFAQELNVYFKEVYRSYVEGDKFLAQTKSSQQYACRSQIYGLGSPIPLKYEALIQK